MKTCIITIIKNEHNYLEQWIAYNISLGIDTLFIFEDVGSESHASITDKYEQVRLMSVLDIYYNDNDREYAIKMREENHPLQYLFQQLAYRRFAKDYDWCFIIDIDEYITCDLPLQETLSMYDEYDAVVMKWQNYNANGHYRKPAEKYNLIEAYTEKCGCSSYDAKRDVNNKIILHCPKYKKWLFSQHHPSQHSNWCYTNMTQDNMTYDHIYLRHYITKSYEEYLHKLYVRGMSYRKHRNDTEFFEYNPNMTDEKKLQEVKELYDLYR